MNIDDVNVVVVDADIVVDGVNFNEIGQKVQWCYGCR